MSGKRNSRTLYRIGEAARVLNLKTCVLRFWEGEFSQLAPVRTPKGQRLYTERDMAVLRRIRSLLHEQGMTIEGARRVLAGEISAPAEGARRVLAGEISAPAEGTAEPLPAPGGVPGHVQEQGSLVNDAPRREDRGEPAAASHTALLAAAVAELESLRGLLRARPTPLDIPPRGPLPPDAVPGAPEEESPPPLPLQGPSL